MSNRHWRKSQSEDFFIKDSKRKGYRSRSVYKLSEIDQKFVRNDQKLQNDQNIMQIDQEFIRN